MMRSKFTKPAILLALIALIFSACTKTDSRPAPPTNWPPADSTSTPVAKSGTLRLTAAVDLTGQPYHSSNLHAVVTIKNTNGQEAVKEQMLTLQLPSPVKTAVLELPEGDYRLTSFRLVYGSVNTHFAAPIAGSSKAAAVQKPLALDFKVEAGKTADVPVEVLRVQESDKPQQYGYPSGAFDNGQADASPFIKVKIRAIMKIGDVVYDSIPASLALTTWNEKGEMTTTYTALAPGVNQIQVLKSATKFDFMVSKWGTNDAMTLNRQDVDENTIYTLGGSKEAKKLKSERVYKIVDGKDVADTKTDYFYDYAGNLLKIDYWMRKQDNTPYFAMADWFEYSNGRVAGIKRVNVENNSTLKQNHFTYDNQGRIVSMTEVSKDHTTSGTATYLPSLQRIEVLYNLPSGHQMNYNMSFNKGNVVHTTAANTNGSFEEGRYSYDFSINPYAHMNRPDLFLSNQSKNNVTSQQKQYTGAFPTSEPYSMFYKYDADGYPTEVVKNYKSYSTGNFIFSTKTVFVY